ncbi:unnamed protein product, partial [Prorocentrum cordatum]
FAGSRFCRQASPRTASWAPVGLTTSLGKAEGGGQEAPEARGGRAGVSRPPAARSLRPSPALPPRGIKRGERKKNGERKGRGGGGVRRDEGGTSRQALAPALAVNSRPALAQRQQSRRPQTGGRADPDTHTHTHTHTQHNKKTPGLVKRRAARAPARRPSQAPCRHALRTAPRAAARRRAQRGPRRATDRLRGGPAAAAALRSGGDDLLRP